jgi:predicted transcriptional regulator of viral defense system
MDETTQKFKGIGKKSRLMLSQVIRQSNGFINTALVQKILHISRPRAKLYLSRWAQGGWLKRIRRGSYIPLEVETQNLSLVMEDPWIIAMGMFSPCYIGGWTAAHHWELTDQLYNDTLVLSTHPLPHFEQKIRDHTYIVRRINLKKMFGLRILYRGNAKIQISDLHKTIVDILDNPVIGGGIRSAMDFLESYLRSPDKNLDRILEYAKKMGNRTIFKRLGYLLSVLKCPEKTILAECEASISKGYSQLDPMIKGDKLIKKWRIWVPNHLYSI